MTFLEECIQDSLPVWKRCLNTPFVRGIGDGTLDESCFKGYIVDDSLYLREYTKVFAWGILHSHDMDEIRSYYSLLAFIRESEDRTRQYYLERYQLTDREIQPLPLRVENQAYVDYMIAAAREGQGAAECMMACLPCMLSYGWIFGELIRRAPGVKDTPLLALCPGLCGQPVRNGVRAVGGFHQRRLPGPGAPPKRALPGDLLPVLGPRASFLGDERPAPGRSIIPCKKARPSLAAPSLLFSRQSGPQAGIAPGLTVVGHHLGGHLLISY